MDKNTKRVLHPDVTLRQGEFRNDSSMTRKLPEHLKRRILAYLEAPEIGPIGDVRMVDPVTGKCYSHTSLIREKDGFSWSSAVIYMLKHYDVKLSDEFIALFE